VPELVFSGIEALQLGMKRLSQFFDEFWRELDIQYLGQGTSSCSLTAGLSRPLRVADRNGYVGI
jgi:hypothetical protein